jgi:hypothetical protein
MEVGLEEVVELADLLVVAMAEFEHVDQFVSVVKVVSSSEVALFVVVVVGVLHQRSVV